MAIVEGPNKRRQGKRNASIPFPVNTAGGAGLRVLLKNTVEQGEEAPTGTATTLCTIPDDAMAAAVATFRNAGTVGNWYVSFNGQTPTTTDYAIKLGPGSTSIARGEAYTEENPPVGAI